MWLGIKIKEGRAIRGSRERMEAGGEEWRREGKNGGGREEKRTGGIEQSSHFPSLLYSSSFILHFPLASSILSLRLGKIKEGGEERLREGEGRRKWEIEKRRGNGEERVCRIRWGWERIKERKQRRGVGELRREEKGIIESKKQKEAKKEKVEKRGILQFIRVVQ